VLWKRSCDIGFSSKVYLGANSAIRAARYVVNHHISLAMQARTTDQDPGTHLKEIERLIKMSENWDASLGLRYSLGNYHSSSGERTIAQQLLLDDMKAALGLLFDDDPENDFMGYMMVGDVLLHAGDDLNALSAYSLLRPDDCDTDKDQHEPQDAQGSKNTSSSDESGTRNATEPRMIFFCDGRCGKLWSAADDLYVCKVCEGVHLDADCLEKLRNGTLKTYVCNAEHDFLHIPALSSKEYREVRKDNIKVGGKLVEGTRIGGEIIRVQEWLDLIRDEWGIEKVNKEAEKEALDTGDNSE
jgi:hypothetical protein